VGPESDVFEERNADTWQPDWHHLESRHPSLTDSQVRPIGSLAPAAPPQFPGTDSPTLTHSSRLLHPGFSLQLFTVNVGLGQSTYYQSARPPYPIYPDNICLPQNPGATSLTAFTQLSPNNLDHQPWQQLPYTSLPQHRPRHLINPPQTPSIRVTGTVGTGDEVFAPPHSEFAAWPYISPASGPPRNINSTFDTFTMGNTLLPVNPPTTQLVQLPNKHERSHSINSNSDMPTPVSMSGAHSSLSSPVGEQRTTISSPHTHARQVSEGASSQDEHDGSLRKNHSYKRAEEPPRNHEAKMICKHQECIGLIFERKCEWR
jgi:hypothetical protein